MLRLAVLAGLLVSAAWFAREAQWLRSPLPLPSTTPYQRYTQSLERSGLAATTLGREWIAAGTRAVRAAQPLTLPATQRGEFVANRPTALAYRVALKRGQRVDVTTSMSSDVPTRSFVDVFESLDNPQDAPRSHHGALEVATYEAEEDREVVVRIQPELLRSGRLAVTLRAAPALRFPVADARPRDLQSVFGDPRDAGRREHEGVDIFAKRGTPVLSATNGIVTRVAETGRGGRVVWVWDPGRGLMLYYAHLHEQNVTTGERVNAGDILGSVGNTGNARTTPPHLHFGVYERGRGAIDPYWFIALPPTTTSAAHQPL
jgi:murein DD-endopeptidase MepM/ murein hydrolase activator NlpD